MQESKQEVRKVASIVKITENRGISSPLNTTIVLQFNSQIILSEKSAKGK